MKILFILEHFHPYIGGAEYLFKELSTRLVKQGYQVTVLTSHFDSNLSKKEQVEGVEIIRRSHGRYAFTFFTIWQAIKLARRHDIIQTTTYNAAIPAWIASSITRTPVSIVVHEYWDKLWFKLPFFSKISSITHYVFEKVILRLPYHQIVAVSKFTKQKLGSNRTVTCIYPGLDTINFPDYHGGNDFLYAGRMSYSKGIDLLIKGFHMALSNHSDLKLTIACPSQRTPVLDWAKVYVRDNELGKSIHFRHDISESELHKAICNARCMIVPSLSEGFGFSAAKACQIGCPVITSGKGALPEVVSGKFIKLESHTPEAVATAIALAKSNEYDQVDYKSFDIKDTIVNFQELYQKMIPG